MRRPRASTTTTSCATCSRCTATTTTRRCGTRSSTCLPTMPRSKCEPHGVYVGKASIRRYFLGLTGGRQGLVQGQLNNQLQLSPVITLSADGQRAQARWRAIMQDGVFNQERQLGRRRLRERIREAGWRVEDREAAPVCALLRALRGRLDAHDGRAQRTLSASPLPRPTGRPAERHATWPTRYIMPMHYASGRRTAIAWRRPTASTRAGTGRQCAAHGNAARGPGARAGTEAASA